MYFTWADIGKRIQAYNYYNDTSALIFVSDNYILVKSLTIFIILLQKQYKICTIIFFLKYFTIRYLILSYLYNFKTFINILDNNNIILS